MKKKSLIILTLFLSFIFSACLYPELNSLLRGSFDLKEIVDVSSKKKTKIDINSYTTDVFPQVAGNAINFTDDDKFSFYYQHEGNDDVIDGTFEVGDNAITFTFNDGTVLSRSIICHDKDSFIISDTIQGKEKCLEMVQAK
jgi:hypothetical protein